MVPTTPLPQDGRRPTPHESINDLPVHTLTTPQIFHPVSESRQFTRVHAGRVFSAAPGLPHSKDGEPHNTPEAIARVTQNPDKIEKIGKIKEQEEVLQPADVRIPHPHMVAFEHDNVHLGGEHRLRNKRFNERLEAEEAAERKRKEQRKADLERKTQRVVPEEARFEFRFRDVTVTPELVGKDGRGTKAPGSRYGVPRYDRKRGDVKIPTKADA